jgi:uncharacterized OB-fold protein
VGIAGQKFFEELKNNAKIVGTKCNRCNLIYVPAKLYCERCFEELQEYVDVGKTGEIFTYTIAYQDRDENKKNNPSIIAVIKIADGAIIHFIKECKIEDLKIGMKVEAVFKPEKERAGSILDIAYFKPI